MVTCQVYGEIAGIKAAEYAIRMENGLINTDDSDQKIGSVEETILAKKVNLDIIKKKMQDAAQKYLLIDRNEEGLSEYIRIAQKLEKQIEEAPEGECCPENINVYHTLITTTLMAESARRRKESRGSHQRSDYPLKNKMYGYPIVIKRENSHIAQKIKP